MCLIPMVLKLVRYILKRVRPHGFRWTAQKDTQSYFKRQKPRKRQLKSGFFWRSPPLYIFQWLLWEPRNVLHIYYVRVFFFLLFFVVDPLEHFARPFTRFNWSSFSSPYHVKTCPIIICIFNYPNYHVNI